ncbi:CpaD family pilus assembly lipoprotein [Sphingosinicella sp. CPCC 101087]|uniref:CpaD family pilus assembly protein n=1 Tax=Sphingosinicella sp. CPCC 101087 TaxID=2497754 RepID=UPI0013EB23A3|nr:CpaD family pilus assembly lipoprotein [Sphingosinicella sp. CPCC 101087]
MTRITTLAALAALGLAAGGCAFNQGPTTPANNRTLNSLHQPVVQRTDYVLDLSSSGDALSEAELQRLDAWLQSIGTGYGDSLAIDEPRGFFSPQARDAITRIAADYGMEVADGAPVLTGNVQPGMVRVIATRTTASVSGCPDWSEPDIIATTSSTSNYGCATNSNLAAMVANPEDLVLGQEGTTIGSGTTASRAVRTYRARQPGSAPSLPSASTGGQ